MRTISTSDEPIVSTKTKKSNLQTFSTDLSDGRTITIREMTGRDLIYLEKDLAKAGDVERGMRVIERLIVGDTSITYDEILDLGVKDFRKLSDLVAKANGTEEEDPN